MVTVANACQHNRKQTAKGLLRKPSTAQAFCSPKSSRLAEHELTYKEAPEDVSLFLLPLAACSILTAGRYWCARAVCPSGSMGCRLGTDLSSNVVQPYIDTNLGAQYCNDVAVVFGDMLVYALSHLTMD